MPEMVPSASYTVHGIIAPDTCNPSRRSISLRMSSARGMEVYQSFHNSPSFTASVRPSHWSCDNGSSRAYGPLSDTGSSQDITFSLSVIACDKREAFAQGSASDEAIQSYFAVLDCFASLAMTKLPFVAVIHLFRKFSGRPGRAQSIAINSPLPDSVI